MLGPIALLPRRFANALARHCMPFASFVPAACSCTPTSKGQHEEGEDEAHDKNKTKKQPPAADVVGSRGGAVRERRRSSSAAQDQQ